MVGWLVGMCGALGWLWRVERRRVRRLRVEVEELGMWADEYAREREVALRLLEEVRRENAGLRAEGERLAALYVWHVRQSVANGSGLIFRNQAMRKR